MIRLYCFLAIFVLVASNCRAACECGYLDPISGELWTDATITYFNETGLNDVVTNVQQSPGIYGQQTVGQTGTGQQAWSLVGDHVNDWEESFGATYRSAVSYNNTFSNTSLGLGMQVSPADEATHIVNGSQIVTRRRDIQFGSFRAYIIPASSFNRNGGSAFKFGVSYNDSETVDVGLYTSDYGYDNHTLKWSYSATGKQASPLSLNLTSAYPGVRVENGLEHRIDWSSAKQIGLGNSGSNETANHITYVKGSNATNLPTSPAPVSFQAWSNGEPSASMGPPRYEPAVTHILYTRFFFNSTLSQRWDQFNQQCQIADASTSVCNTDDNTLRDSTIFDLAALDQIEPISVPFTVPLYAIIAESISLGGILILVLHVFVTRRYFGKGKKIAAVGPMVEKRLNHQLNHQHSFPTMTGSDSDQEKNSIQPDSMHIAENVLLSRRNSSSQQGSRRNSIVGMGSRRNSIIGQGGSRSNSIVGGGHTGGSSIGHGRFNNGSRQSLPHYSSRPSSILHGHSTTNAAGPRDITDLDNVFDGWETDSSGYDSDDFNEAERISGNFEQYHDRDRDDDDNDRLQEVEILPLTMPKDETPSLENGGGSDSNDSDRTKNKSPVPQIVQWQTREGEQQLAQPVAVSDAQEIARDNSKGKLSNWPTIIHLFFRRIDNFLFIPQTNVFTSTGQRRIDYLDGMRGAACLFVSLGHFTLIFYNGIPNPGGYNHYPGFEHFYRYIFGPIGTNPSLLLGTFFALPARTMCQRYLLKGGMAGMADTTVRRIPRLMLPVTAAALINYFLMDVNGFKWVQRLASRSWSVWSYWQSYDNALVFANSVLTLCWGGPPDQPALVTGYATGVLWTIPVIVQGMWTCMIASLIAFEIKTHWKRFAFYFLAVLFSWYANTWDCFFLTGLIVGDLDSKIRYREKAKKGIPLPIPNFRRRNGEGRRWVRLPGKVLAWMYLLACCTQQWIGYVTPAPGSTFNFQEHALHPDWQTARPFAWRGAIGYAGYTNPNITGFFLIIGLFMVADLTEGVQKFFRLRVWHWLGVHSMSVYLLHGIAWWTWATWVCLTMLKAGAPYWAATLVCLVTGYAVLFSMCICFTYTFEVWAVLLAKAVWRAASGNMGRKV